MFTLPDYPFSRLRWTLAFVVGLITAYQVNTQAEYRADGIFVRSGSTFPPSSNTAPSLGVNFQITQAIATTASCFSLSVFLNGLTQNHYRKNLRRVNAAFFRGLIPGLTIMALGSWLLPILATELTAASIVVPAYLAVSNAYVLLDNLLARYNVRPGQYNPTYPPSSLSKVYLNRAVAALSTFVLLWQKFQPDQLLPGAQDLWTIPGNSTLGTLDTVQLSNSPFLPKLFSKLSLLIGIGFTVLAANVLPYLKLNGLFEQRQFRLTALAGAATLLFWVTSNGLTSHAQMHPRTTLFITTPPHLVNATTSTFEFSYAGPANRLSINFANSLFLQGFLLTNYFAMWAARVLNISIKNALKACSEPSPEAGYNFMKPRWFTAIFDLLTPLSAISALCLSYKASLTVTASLSALSFLGSFLFLHRYRERWAVYTDLIYQGRFRTWHVPIRFAATVTTIAALMLSKTSPAVIGIALPVIAAISAGLMHYLERNRNPFFWRLLHLSEILMPTIARCSLIAITAKSLEAGSKIFGIPFFGIPAHVLAPLILITTNFIRFQQEKSQDPNRLMGAEPDEAKPLTSANALKSVALAVTTISTGLALLAFRPTDTLKGTYRYTASGFGAGTGETTLDLFANNIGVLTLLWVGFSASAIPIVLPLLIKLVDAVYQSRRGHENSLKNAICPFREAVDPPPGTQAQLSAAPGQLGSGDGDLYFM